ncbi:MAG: SH3 domain-containing protein [Anaerolineales bacterium]|nr:SH3 domain-containing protein [Anaerolineales bacterium]
MDQLNLEGDTATTAAGQQTAASAQAANASAATASQAQTRSGRPAGARMGAPLAGAPPFGAAAGDASTSGDVATTGAVVAAAPTEAVVIPAVAGTENASLWDAAGVLVENLDSGDALQIMGRSNDGEWLAVNTDAGESWVKAASVIAFGLDRLPIQELPVAIPTGSGHSTSVTDATSLAMTVPVGAGSTDGAGALSPASTQDIAAGASAALATSSELAPSTSALVEAPASARRRSCPAVAAPLTATVTLEDSRLNVRSGPSTDYKVLAKAEAGDVFTVVGRTENGDWLQVEPADESGASGWAAAEYLQIDGDASSLPVVDVDAPADPTEATPATSNSANTTAPAVAGAVATIQKVSAAVSSTGTTGLQGTLVFQQSRGGMISAYNQDTGSLTPLTNGSDPAISPDGSAVAFVRDGAKQAFI